MVLVDCFLLAVSNNHVEIVQLLVDHKETIDQIGEDTKFCLAHAIECTILNEDLNMLKKIFEYNKSKMNSCLYYKRQAILDAACYGW